ncbi:MAG: sugar kinase [Planctomycetota bacterium]|nr:sugar kinase [Planctomycetota bacterium]
MSRVVTFGEIMLRLSPPGFQRFVQAQSFDVTYGGGEANVAVSLAGFGLHTSFVTCLPDNDLGHCAASAVRAAGVDVSHVAWQGNRLGIYFLENGASQRPSKVVYDRSESSISQVQPGDIDWAATFEGATWFHWTGITPAISQSAADTCLEACRAAKEARLTISADLNFRKKLWNYGKPASEVMPGLVQYVDVAIGNEEDAEKVFGIKPPEVDVEGGKVSASAYQHVCDELTGRFPNLKKIAITLRGSINASHNTWSGLLYDGNEMHIARDYDITHIVDRVGGGDSFAAGLIFALISEKSAADAINFAVAASCLKHTIPGDCNLVTADEVEALAGGSGSGRVQR